MNNAGPNSASLSIEVAKAQVALDLACTAFTSYDDWSDTLEHFEQHVKDRAKPGQDILDSLTPEKCHLWHMASCIPGEGGELFDALKKYIIYNKNAPDVTNVVEELGDLLFYIQGVIQALQDFGLNVDIITILQQNIDKLEKRYGSTYSDKAAQERADKLPLQTHYPEIAGQFPCLSDPTTEND